MGPNLTQFQQLSLTKHKPNNVGNITLERQAGGKIFYHTGIRTIRLAIPNQNCPLAHQSDPYCCYAATNFVLKASFTSE